MGYSPIIYISECTMNPITFFFRVKLLSRLMEAESLLKEATKILSYECPKSEYGHLISASQESGAQLTSYIQSVREM